MGLLPFVARLEAVDLQRLRLRARTATRPFPRMRCWRRSGSSGSRVEGTATPNTGLGLMYLLGGGVPHDPAEGVRLMTAAAEHGYPEPIRVLADSYASGQFGVELDEGLAAQWAATLAAHLRAHPEDRRAFKSDDDG